MLRPARLALAGIALAACSGRPERAAQSPAADTTLLRTELLTRYGPAGKPRVMIRPDGRHLTVELRDTTLMQLTEPDMDRKAEEIARFVMARYPEAGNLDSIRVRLIGLEQGPLLLARIRDYPTGRLR